jgi:hypothetical protein
MFERDENGSPILKLNPMASNVLPSGDILYTKIHGVKASFNSGETKTLEFTIPYPVCMFMGAEIVHEVETTTNMEVAHPVAGTIEQYGFNVNTGKDKYTRDSKYGAALQSGLVLKCEITNTAPTSMEIGANFIMYEVRSPQ